LTPFLVIFYNKAGRVASYLLFSAAVGLGVYLNYQTSYAHDLTAGIFSLENYYMFAYYINKPWYKIGVYFVGLMSAMFFIDVRNYKKSKREGTLDHLQYTTVNFLHRANTRVNGNCCKRFTPLIFVIVAAIGYYLCAFICFPVMMAPYDWDDN
jgi:hypothetical protein